MQRSSIVVGFEKGGQAEEAFALCRRDYSWIQGTEEGDSRRIGVPLPSVWTREDKQRRPSQLAGAVILRRRAFYAAGTAIGFFFVAVDSAAIRLPHSKGNWYILY